MVRALFVITAFTCALLIIASASAAPNFLRYFDVRGAPYNASYTPRAITINGVPSMFASGSVHYPRSTPGQWPRIMQRAIDGGLNMIEVYVFWNYHETVEGEFDWSERGDLRRFLQIAADANLFVNLRIGPYVCAGQ